MIEHLKLSLFQQKKYSEALSCLNSALEMASASSAFKLKKARALVLSGKVDDAYALLTQLMRSTNNPEIVYLRGKCLYYQVLYDGCSGFTF